MKKIHVFVKIFIPQKLSNYIIDWICICIVWSEIFAGAVEDEIFVNDNVFRVIAMSAAKVEMFAHVVGCKIFV